MLFAGRRLEDIREDDLESVVLGATETETVEFKAQMWGVGADQRREMLRDVSSLANHTGGEIYVGVAEDESGTAVALPGVSSSGHSERILNSCRSNIDPPLQGLSVHPVPLASGNSVLIVRIPRSLTSPHMITFEGMNQFWKRYGRTKERMTVQEIEDAFISRMQAESRAERFQKERLDRLYDSVGQARWLFLTVTPIFLGRPVVDVFNPEVEQLFTYPLAVVRTAASGSELHMSSNFVRPTLHGLRGEMRGERVDLLQFLELHRTGHLEIGVRWIFIDTDAELVYASPILEYSFNFLALAQRIHAAASLGGPVIVKLCLLNVSSSTLAIGDTRAYPPPTRWTPPTLELPAFSVGDLATSSLNPIVKSMNDALWNAYGLRECTHLNSEGQLSRESGLQFVHAEDGR